MKKEWMVSTALAGILATLSVSSHISPLKAANLNSNDDQNDNQDHESLNSNTDQVASVMDNQGAPIDEAVADDIESKEQGQSSVLSSATVKAITQSGNAVIEGVSQSDQAVFLSKVGPIAQSVAAKHNLYASVMIAQSIVESTWGQSDLSTKYNNYFGIKGNYNGSYINFPTKEWSAEKGYYTIYDNFRSYPSIYASYEDNANVLRNGLSGATNFFKGTWKENTKSYKDATSWLQSRYATSPIYAQTLNSIIQMYNLTKYDTNSNFQENNQGTVVGTKTSMDDTATIVNTNSAHVYINADPNKIAANRILANDTSWHISSKVVAKDGTTYYQVASNEYVAAKDVKLASDKSDSNIKISDTAIVINNKGTVVYSAANTETSTGRVLPYQSSWFTNAYSVDDNGNTFYFIGNNSYVLANNVKLKSQTSSGSTYLNDDIVKYPDVVNISAIPTARVYDDRHNERAISLANGTDWRIDEKSIHGDGSVWYRVATNQWVRADDVQVTGSNYVTSITGKVKINYIPGYGINVYNSPAINNKFTGTRLADGTTWKVTSKQIVNGKVWFKVFAGWIEEKNCIYMDS